MGRIDDALRRSTGAGVLAPPSSQPEQFVSAWGTTTAVAEPTIQTIPAVVEQAVRTIPREPSPEPAPARKTREKPGAALATLVEAWGERLTDSPQCSPVLVEQFRRLAAALHKTQSANGIKVVMVTSAGPADGKTMTAVNLALVLSGSYKRRVLLIDADLRRPTIGEAVGLRRTSGLSEALRARTERKLDLVPLTPTLTLLPAGEPDPDPIGSLTSARMRHILEEAAAEYDWVILDAPPVGLLADAGLMAELVQGTVFVVRAEHSQYPLVKSAIDGLGHDRVLGIVLNAVDSRSAAPYGQSHKYSAGDRSERPS